MYNNTPRKGKKIEFENNGRSGYVRYTDDLKSTRFYIEMGGGDCIFYMVIPSKEQWETQTGYSLAERDEILHFIAEECLEKQTSSPGAYYNIEEKHILFMNKED